MKKRQQWTILLSGLMATTMATTVAAEDLKPLKGQEVLKVCADKNNMPYSNDKLEGYDNKIAEMLGEELGIPVEYYWFPQRLGYSRNTLKKESPDGGYMCDVSLNISSTTDFIKPTEPYYESIEVVAYRSGEGYEINELADLKAVNEEHGPLKIGLFDRALTTKQIIEMGLADNIVYYQMMSGGWETTPGRIIDDLAAGKVDVVPMWGPIAGYQASKQDVDITIQPLNELGQRHVFSFSMGTRYGEPQWTALLNKFIAKRQDDIDAIIAEYHLPSLENVSPTPAKRVRKDDDD